MCKISLLWGSGLMVIGFCLRVWTLGSVSLLTSCFICNFQKTEATITSSAVNTLMHLFTLCAIQLQTSVWSCSLTLWLFSTMLSSHWQLADISERLETICYRLWSQQELLSHDPLLIPLLFYGKWCHLSAHQTCLLCYSGCLGHMWFGSSISTAISRKGKVIYNRLTIFTNDPIAPLLLKVHEGLFFNSRSTGTILRPARKLLGLAKGKSAADSSMLNESRLSFNETWLLLWTSTDRILLTGFLSCIALDWKPIHLHCKYWEGNSYLLRGDISASSCDHVGEALQQRADHV